jgi:hypothetical protein
MKPRFASILILLILLFGCSKNEITAPAQRSPTITADEYVVLAALMDSLLGRATVSTIVIGDSTDAGIFSQPTDSALTLELQYVSQHLTMLSTETMFDFKVKNLTRAYIDAPKSIHRVFVRSSDTNMVFPSCQVSRVGFSFDGKQALVYSGIVWAPLAGFGSYYVLSRAQGMWIIVGSVMVWIS